MFKLKVTKGDVFGGLTAGVVALPLALAFGVQSGMGAVAGLYGAIFLGICASAFGGTPSQISGPTGPVVVVTASVVSMFIAKMGSLEAAMGAILFTFVLTGVFLALFGVLRLGQYIRYIPYPVLSGFMSGIGIIIISTQLFPLIGQDSPQGIITIYKDFPVALADINISALLLAVVTIAIVYLTPKVSKVLPGPLVALVVVTLCNYFIKLNVPLIGEIPTGIPAPDARIFGGITFENFLLAIAPALTIAGLSAIDTLLTSVVADNLTKTRHHSNKELIGQGIGVALAGIFGGIPGSGAAMRTLVNIRNGGRNKSSGIIHGVLLIAILLGLGSLVKWIPLSVLAGILVTVGIGIIDKKGIKDLRVIPKADAATLVVVLLLTVFVNLLQAVGIGMIIASILFMKRAGDLVESRTTSTPSQITDKEIPWDDEKDLKPETLNRIYIQRLDGPVFFGGINKFNLQMASIPDHAEVVIIRMRLVPFLDQSGLYAIENAVRNLQERGITVAFTIIQPQPLYMMERINLVPGLVPKDLCFPTFEDCSAWINRKYSIDS